MESKEKSCGGINRGFTHAHGFTMIYDRIDRSLIDSLKLASLKFRLFFKFYIIKKKWIFKIITQS